MVERGDSGWDDGNGGVLAAVRRWSFTGPFGPSRASEGLVCSTAASGRLLPSDSGGRSLPRATVPSTLAGFLTLDLSGLAIWTTVRRR